MTKEKRMFWMEQRFFLTTPRILGKKKDKRDDMRREAFLRSFDFSHCIG